MTTLQPPSATLACTRTASWATLHRRVKSPRIGRSGQGQDEAAEDRREQVVPAGYRGDDAPTTSAPPARPQSAVVAATPEERRRRGHPASSNQGSPPQPDRWRTPGYGGRTAVAARGSGLAPHVAGWAPSSGAYLNSWLRRRLGRGRRLEGQAALQVPAAPGRTGRPPPSKPARLRGHRARPGQPGAPSVLCRGGREARSRSGSAPFSKINRWKFLKRCLKVHNIVYSIISRPRENPTSVNGEKARSVRRPGVDFGRLHAGPAFGRLGAAQPIQTRLAGPNIPSRRVRRGSARNITAAGRRRCSRRSPAATLRAPCLRRDDPPTHQQRPRRSTSRRGVGRRPEKTAGAPRRPPVPNRRTGSARCGRGRGRRSSASR